MKKRINRESKKLIVLSGVVSLALIINIVIYILVYRNSDAGRSFIDRGQSIFTMSKVPLFIVLIVLAILSFLYVLYKKTHRGKNVEKLNEEYDLVYEQISQYVGVSGLTYFEKKDLIEEILDLFLQAQEDGKNVNGVIGDNYKDFVENMILAFGKKNYFLYDILNGCQYLILYFFMVQCFMFLESENKSFSNFFNVETEYSTIFNFVLVALVLLPLVSKKIRKNKSENKENNSVASGFSVAVIIYTIIFFILFVITMKLIRTFLSHIPIVEEFLNGGIILINSPIVLLIMIALIPVFSLLKKRV